MKTRTTQLIGRKGVTMVLISDRILGGCPTIDEFDNDEQLWED